jgi:phage-related minor tail protein
MQRHLQRMKNIKTEGEEEAARQENYILGAEQALEDIKKSLTSFKIAQDAVAMTWQKIGSAIDNFVETGKFKFKDFAASIIQDLTKMILKAMIFKYIFEPIMGAFGLKIPGMAEGGNVKPGQPYIVGEKGPELFVPPGAGTIIPNNKLGMGKGMATGAVNAPITNNYITNNISAIDAKSVAQLFAENRKTLLGTVRMAEKEMPYMGRA